MSASDVRSLLVLNSFRIRLRKYVWSVSFNSLPYCSNFLYNCKTSRDVDALMVNNVSDSLKSHLTALTVQYEVKFLHRAHLIYKLDGAMSMVLFCIKCFEISVM